MENHTLKRADKTSTLMTLLLLLLLQIADVSVEVATVDHTLQKICRTYRKSRRKPKGLQKLWARLLGVPHVALITAAVVFVLVVTVWSLLWVFICKPPALVGGVRYQPGASHTRSFSPVCRESNSSVYFAGMFRVADVEFVPEYRQEESHEFVSMATKIQHVVHVCLQELWERLPPY